MKRVLDLVFGTQPRRPVEKPVKEANIALEQALREHRKATVRTTRAMEESVRIAQDSLKRQGQQ